MNKYTIPGGSKFGVESQPFFDWVVASGVEPSRINPDADVEVSDTLLTAVTYDGEQIAWPLTPMPEQVERWLAIVFGTKAAELDDIKDRLDRLADARKRSADAKQEADELRAEILAIMTVRKATIGTVAGAPVIGIKTITMPGRLDRKGLEAEYPTIVERFTGPETTQTRLEFL
ncbi:MAG TPA: hypothetical protein VJ777_14900 [Mycobacterium sp.]|nr:hypothetical protein [Mycobacterium sp.]